MGDVDTVYRGSAWRHTVAELIAEDPIFRMRMAEMDMYEFGVYTGSSLAEMATEWSKHNLTVHSVWGFDSFVGVPEEQKDLRHTIPRAGRKHWRPGAFSAAAA